MSKSLAKEVCEALNPVCHKPSTYVDFSGHYYTLIPKAGSWLAACGVTVPYGVDEGYETIWRSDTRNCPKCWEGLCPYPKKSVTH